MIKFYALGNRAGDWFSTLFPLNGALITSKVTVRKTERTFLGEFSLTLHENLLLACGFLKCFFFGKVVSERV